MCVATTTCQARRPIRADESDEVSCLSEEAKGILTDLPEEAIRCEVFFSLYFRWFYPTAPLSVRSSSEFSFFQRSPCRLTS